VPHGVAERAQNVMGPKGVGALVCQAPQSRGVLLSAIIDGGGHGARACAPVLSTSPASSASAKGRGNLQRTRWRPPKGSGLRELRDYLNDKLHKQLDELYNQRIDGAPAAATTSTSAFAYVEGESLLMGINDVAVLVGIGPAPRPSLEARRMS